MAHAPINTAPPIKVVKKALFALVNFSGFPLAKTKRKPEYTMASAIIGKPIEIMLFKISWIRPGIEVMFGIGLFIPEETGGTSVSTACTIKRGLKTTCGNRIILYQFFFM
jgi:hypothetical protein